MGQLVGHHSLVFPVVAPGADAAMHQVRAGATRWGTAPGSGVWPEWQVVIVALARARTVLVPEAAAYADICQRRPVVPKAALSAVANMLEY